MALYDQLQVTTVQEELYSTKDATLGTATRHGAWENKKRSCLEHAEVDLTGLEPL